MAFDRQSYMKEYYQKHKEEMKNNAEKYRVSHKKERSKSSMEYRKRKVEELRKQGCTNAWYVVRTGAAPKFKDGVKNEE